jgi:thymidylate kinase
MVLIPRARSIAFMGLDGSGKSAQATLLWQRASARGEPWVMVHHSSTKLPGLAGLKQRIHRPMIELLKRRRVHINVTDQTSEVSGGGTALSWITSAYLIIGSFLKAVWYRWRFILAAGVVSDRCWLDDVVKAHWRFGCRLPAAGLILRVAPKPDVIIVLTGDPATTYRRKKDQNCTYAEYLRKKEILNIWLTDAARRGWNIQAITIDGKPVADVHQTVIGISSRTFHAVQTNSR